jgi:hypothetical protein
MRDTYSIFVVVIDEGRIELVELVKVRVIVEEELFS